MEEAWKKWAHDEYISGLPKGEQEIAEIAFKAAYSLGARAEAQVWSEWILAQPGARDYWEESGGGDFSADDAATMIKDLLNDPG